MTHSILEKRLTSDITLLNASSNRCYINNEDNKQKLEAIFVFYQKGNNKGSHMKEIKSELAGTDRSYVKNNNSKNAQQDVYRSDETGQELTSNQGIKITDNLTSLRASVLAETLLEDIIIQKKMTH